MSANFCCEEEIPGSKIVAEHNKSWILNRFWWQTNPFVWYLVLILKLYNYLKVQYLFCSSSVINFVFRKFLKSIKSQIQISTKTKVTKIYISSIYTDPTIITKITTRERNFLFLCWSLPNCLFVEIARQIEKYQGEPSSATRANIQIKLQVYIFQSTSKDLSPKHTNRHKRERIQIVFYGILGFMIHWGVSSTSQVTTQLLSGYNWRGTINTQGL